MVSVVVLPVVLCFPSFVLLEVSFFDGRSNMGTFFVHASRSSLQKLVS